MGFMDQAMDNYRAPSPEDLEIVLPQRREPKQEQAGSEHGSLGQHGGAADTASNAADTHGDTAAAAAEPVPQRDDPDEGEHTDSTQEQLARRVQRADPDTTPETPSEEATAEEPEPAIEEDEPTPDALPRERATSTGPANPREFTRGLGASYGGSVELTQVKRLPQHVLDRLRSVMARQAGSDFAEAISAPALLTAFIDATLGTDLELDENTDNAADAFREMEPRLAVVESRIDDMNDSINQLAEAMKLSLRRIAETADIVDILDYTTAYLLADRVVGLSTNEVTAKNVDVAQKAVLTTRERIRERVKEQRGIEKRQNSGWRKV